MSADLTLPQGRPPAARCGSCGHPVKRKRQTCIACKAPLTSGAFKRRVEAALTRRLGLPEISREAPA